MAFISGKTGSASFASTLYKTKSWTARQICDIKDVTNGESGGTGEYIAGVVDCEWEVEMDYYTGNSPFASGKLNAGQTGTLVLLDAAGGRSWTINAIVEQAEEEVPVRGVATVRARGKGTWNGSSNFTPPTS